MIDMTLNDGAALRGRKHDEAEAGWLGRALWRLEHDWLPLAEFGGSLCFVIDECAEVAACFSGDPHPGERATP